MGAFGRKITRTQQKATLKNVDTAKLVEATKALGNIDQVKQLNELLGVVLQIEPMLGELRTVCAMLIQEKLVLERKVQRLEAVLPNFGADVGVSSDYLQQKLATLLAEWDAANPIGEVELPQTVQPALENDPPALVGGSGEP
jgi:hypothetical protein